MMKRVEVAAGVIFRRDGRFLLGQRAPDTFYAGYWEFPGGKVEPGESPADALIRELDEELGIRVQGVRPWITREHRYEHAHVRLHFFEVAEWEGELHDHVHSALSWERVEAPEVGPMLPANGPILKALRLPRWMGITHAAEIGVQRQLAQLDAALAGGLRLVQVREPGMPMPELRAFAGEVVKRAHACGASVVVNGSVELAAEVGADGVHLPAAQLGALARRPELEWVGASCHTRAELERAAELGLDYAVLGAVQPTATHPGQPVLGWERFAELVRGLPMPVLALGGLRQNDVECARTAGAHGIAAIRASWDQS
ncbi:Nudix family hydrolase [Aromatoleum petrolei]|uniref:8-oxo-dGTP diphosphatase n=1 Tax=Aromatoleum petrolei TaxID=76116 RepID=A0ABX1MU65_9RHOO|nr:Nudix family hydrolase [Aromatoleum petrolei]NMF89499.1 Nudix family hydrolase [Aromatoleum petrolei]QTQ37274.1 NUDIX family hydrolase [Aromatoleum petrolei]